jgi:polysaccharide export outer membrane protein
VETTENIKRAVSRRVATLLIGAIAMAALLCGAVLGQNNRGQAQNGAAGGGLQAKDAGQPAARGEQASSVPIAASNGDYHIAPGDEIEIRIEDAPELSRKCTVSAEGDITLNYLNRIGVEQKTPQELEKLIADSLRGRYLKDPSVAVTVSQYNSRSFFIQGAVRQPGPYIVKGQPSLLKLITIAGGLADNHGSTAFIIREIRKEKIPAEAGTTSQGAGQKPPAEAGTTNHIGAAEQAKYDLLKVNINGLFKGEFAQNLDIEPGDIVNIPVTDVFFVTGEVHKPGSFALKEGTTLRQAVSMAEGSTFKASLGSGIIFRDDPATGKRQELKVDVGAVMNGKKDDIPILANDIIIIPNSRSRSVFTYVLNGLGASALRVIP